MISKHHDHFEITQMDKLTVYVAFDHRYHADVVQGYKIKYRETFKGEKPKYKNVRGDGLGEEVTKCKFHFEDEEYITHIGVAYGWSLDRIEFTTNKERHFSAGGKGGSYTRFIMSVDDHDKHPRVVALGIGLGPLDAHQLRVHYLPEHGEHCRDIAWELEQEREKQKEAEEAERLRHEAEEAERIRQEHEAEIERLRLEAEAEAERLR